MRHKKTDLRPINVTTLPYPGFPTDMQAQIMSLMSITPGISVITEKIYPDRFMHVAELNRMGRAYQREGPHAIVEGVKHLSGAPVMASDLTGLGMPCIGRTCSKRQDFGIQDLSSGARI